MKPVAQIGLLSFLLFFLSSCEIAEGIFKLGFNSAIFLVLIVVAIVIWLVVRARKK